MAKYISRNSNDDVFSELLRIEAAEEAKKENQEKTPVSQNNSHRENLYNIDACEDKTGEELIEQAHPTLAETIESYLTNGGVVENLNQEQKSHINSTMRMPSTNVYRRDAIAYAELVSELKIIAEEMNVRGEKEIVKYTNDLTTKFNKMAFWGTVGVVAASIVIPTITAWWYAKHSTSAGEASINTGIDNNIAKLQKNIRSYYDSLNSSATGEQSSPTIDRLKELSSFIVNIKDSRQSFLSNSGKLASRLKENTQLDTAVEPTSAVVKNNINLASQKLKEPSQRIIDLINKYNKRYATYIEKTIVPRLESELAFYEAYFKATENTEPVEKEKGTWDKLKGIFSSSPPDLKSSGEQIVGNLKALIASLKADVQIRELESKHDIDSLSKKIEADISKDFEVEDKPIETIPTKKP